ncbi:MAG: hypothetical protein H6740_21475 [Alphaproteobacteria bacterium]|nr:hypothetical protein [Alphaproteobacteria bacterium]
MPMSQKWKRFMAGFGSQETRYANWSALAKEVLDKLAEAREVYAKIDTTHGTQHDTAIQEIRDKLTEAQELYESGDNGKRRTSLAKLEEAERAAHALLKTIRASLKEDLATLVATDGGVHVLDQMVEDTKLLLPHLSGGKSERSTFLRDAMKARFGLDTVENQIGPGGRDNLRTAYLTMARVPVSHTLSNDRLKVLKLKPTMTEWKERKYGGVYKPSDNEIDVVIAHVVLNTDHKSDDEVPQEHRVEDGLAGFEGCVLHEVGHAYDQDKGIMKISPIKRTALGGWRKETPASVAKAFAKGFNLYSAFPGLPSEFLLEALSEAIRLKSPNHETFWEQYREISELPLTREMIADHVGVAKAVLLRSQEDTTPAWPDGVCPKTVSGPILEVIDLGYKETISDQVLLLEARKAVRTTIEAILEGTAKDTAIATALAHHRRFAGPMPSLTDLKAHDAYKAARALNGKWDGCYYTKGRSGADKTTVGKYTYTVDNGTLYSYEIAARNAGVSQYQFRAPAEYFAELYMFYYAGKLPTQHPLFATLEGLM